MGAQKTASRVERLLNPETHKLRGRAAEKLPEGRLTEVRSGQLLPGIRVKRWPWPVRRCRGRQLPVSKQEARHA